MCSAKQLICRYNVIARVQIYLCLLTSRLIEVCEIFLIIRALSAKKKVFIFFPKDFFMRKNFSCLTVKLLTRELS